MFANWSSIDNQILRMLYRLISSTFKYPIIQKVKRFLRPAKQFVRGKHGIYKALDFIPKDIKTVFDIGAGDGDYALTFAKTFPQATITCFEPNNLSFKKLEKKAKNIGSRIILVKKALSDQKGKASLVFDPQTPDGGSIGGSGIKSEEVITETLDSFNKTIDFLKIDAEFHEVKILNGGQETMKKVRYLYLETRLDTPGYFYEILEAVRNLDFSPIYLSEDQNILFERISK